MNNLSWLIYLADVSSSLNVIAAVGAVLCAIVLIGCCVGMAVAADDGSDSALAACWAFFKKTLRFFVPLLLVAALLPSSGTFYAIAASEMGEEVLNSETGGKAVEALNAWLDRQIDGEDE